MVFYSHTFVYQLDYQQQIYFRGIRKLNSDNKTILSE